MATVGQELAKQDSTKQTGYEYARCLLPMQTIKAFENYGLFYETG